ncbi:MAG TPA: FliH/SctL family protein [Candidatus Binataceae bacterium]|nr:FliH/SctL family protein [Candidatus Binataceae bacterium]
MSTAQSYRFPTLSEFDPAVLSLGIRSRSRADETAVADAITRGYAEGRERGETEVAAAVSSARENGFREGLASGHEEGRVEMLRTAEALGAALAEFNEQRATLSHECEQFCVDLALAIVTRIVDESPVRAEFVTREVSKALKLLAPEPATEIHLNPDDHKLAKDAFAGLPLKDDATLSPGHVRVEAGRLLVEAGIEPALEQIKSAVLEVKKQRTLARAAKTATKTRTRTKK